MLPSDSRTPQSTKFRINRLGLAWLVLTLSAVAAILTVRYLAVDRDFAIANQVSYGIFLLLVLMTLGFMFAASLFRWAAGGVLLIGLAAGVFFFLYRWERLDGELRPRFTWRWAPEPALPQPEDAAVGMADVLSTMLLPRSTDSPRFLGPNRNATWPNMNLSTDWGTEAPRIVWKQAIGEGWSSFAVQGTVAVTMEQRADEEWVSAYSVDDGQMLWNYVIPGRYASAVAGNGPRCTPAIEDGCVYACSAISDFVCLDLSSGALLWSKDLNSLAGTDRSSMESEVNWGRSASPLIHGDAVIIAMGGTGQQRDSLVCFDRKSGEELWRSGGEQISYSSPALLAIQECLQLVYVSASSISGFDPEGGRRLWRVEFEGLSGAPNVAQPMAIDEQHIFFSKGYGIGSVMIRVGQATADTALATESGPSVGPSVGRSVGPSVGSSNDSAWSAEIVAQNSNVLRTKFTNPLLYEDHLYGLSDGILECIDVGGLERRWKRGRYRHGQLLRLGKHLLVFSEDGRLVLVDADPNVHREVAQFQVLDNVCWNLPALTGNRLLVRNARELACVQLPLQADSNKESTGSLQR
jgi:outer membrane protein assembly factor BamB